MTLYSITTSERASKGQGGNDFLETVYTVGEAKNPITIGKTVLTKESYGYLFLCRIGSNRTIEIKLDEKGEQQKTS